MNYTESLRASITSYRLRWILHANGLATTTDEPSQWPLKLRHPGQHLPSWAITAQDYSTCEHHDPRHRISSEGRLRVVHIAVSFLYIPSPSERPSDPLSKLPGISFMAAMKALLTSWNKRQTIKLAYRLWQAEASSCRATDDEETFKCAS